MGHDYQCRHTQKIIIGSSNLNPFLQEINLNLGKQDRMKLQSECAQYEEIRNKKVNGKKRQSISRSRQK